MAFSLGWGDNKVRSGAVRTHYMTRVRMLHRLLACTSALHRRTIPVLILSFWLSTGCVVWRVAPLTPVSDTTTQTLRLTRHSGEIIVLTDAIVSRDSIVGVSDGNLVSIPRPDVMRVEQERVSWSRTLVRAGLVFILFFGVVANMALAS